MEKTTKRKRRRVNYRKLVAELLCLPIILVGIVLIILNFTHTVPDGVENDILLIIIAYGFPFGLGLIIFGVDFFCEVRNSKFPKKRR